jgi:choline dehydrogenase-like flavoprotein
VAIQLSDQQRRTLEALGDTFVAAVPHDPDPDGFYGRPASELAAAAFAEAYLQTSVPEEQALGLLQLLDVMGAQGLADLPLPAREAIVTAVASSGSEAEIGVDSLRQLLSMLAYGMPDASGVNPFWRTWDYPGPVSVPPQEPRPLQPLVPDGDLTLETDVVVIGSGSGGGVIAGELATAGHDVVVLEMGGYFDRPDFNQYELWAYENLYLRGNYFPTTDRNVSLVAGSNLGGGSTVNWSQCLRPTPARRRRWAEEFGLDDVATAAFDAHLDAVLRRMSANSDCSDYNGAHQRLIQGAEALGWSAHKSVLNLRHDRYDPAKAGFSGFGDQTGAKQGTLETWLRDAAAAGARILARTTARRILVEGGRAAGVEAVHADPATGASATVTVRARHVVVACGALETPALLLRSGIGGPAVGKGLRLHPSVIIGGRYDEDQRGWWGPPQAAVVDQFAEYDVDGTGYLIECVQHSYALLAATKPWLSAAQHKEQMAQTALTSWFVAVVQDQGSGEVTIDADGNALHTYPLDHPDDLRRIRDGLGAMARLHEAAGAQEIHSVSRTLAPWRRGDDLEAWIAALQREPLGAGGMTVFSAHQMGSAAMGTDPATSVTDPSGRLHDTDGVWIGDTSVFPTCSGVNPMVTCMAMARRTAASIAQGTRSNTTNES